MPIDKDNLLRPSIAPVKKLRQSLKRMKLKYVDVNLVHGPVHPGDIAQAAKGMADCVKEGMALTVGVSNYSAADMLRFAAELKDHGDEPVRIQHPTTASRDLWAYADVRRARRCRGAEL